MAILVGVDGVGSTTMPIPASVGRPAIVHAKYDGTASFVVSALDARGLAIATPVRSIGPYDGTFPVGFVDRTDDPATSLHVDTTGPWHLDISKPVLAQELKNRGVSGRGDAVVSYNGPAVSVHITYPARSAFTVDVFGKKKFAVLVSTVGPYDATIALPAGPAFVSVTATGDWSMVFE